MNASEITGLQRVNLRPGDRLVLRYPGRLTAQQAVTIRARLLEWAGDGFPVLVLDEGASLTVISADGDAGEIVR